MGSGIISEFEDVNKKPITPFSLDEGYCGICWKEKIPVCGTYKPFPFRLQRKDKRFAKRNTRSRRRSIICLPVKDIVGNIVAIMSVDSLIKWDFIMNNDLREEFDEISLTVKNKLLEYIDIGRI